MTPILQYFRLISACSYIVLSVLTTGLVSPGYGEGLKDCGENCFNSEIISLEELETGCLIYEIKVTYEGKCSAALSHYTLDMGCGVFSESTNSAGWPIVLNETDPTSGLTGLKVDDITEFGDESPLESFTLKFTFCPTNCEEGKSCFSPQVAYKASTCVYTDIVDAQCIKPLSVQAQSTDLMCAEVNEGSVTLQIEGGKEPYQINWKHGATGSEINRLNAGTYSYTVTSADGQQFEGNATVSSPTALSLVTSVTQPTCDENAKGAILLSVTGGTFPYSYQWGDGNSDVNRSDLPPGLYDITVTDQNGCSISESVEILAPSQFEIDAKVVQPDCGNPLGSIELNSNTEDTYIYQWSDGSTERVRTELTAGTYSAVISNSQGCEVEESFIITATDSPMSISGELIQPTCEQANGSIQVVVSGGISPYTYQWAQGGETAELSDLVPGNYTVSVTDASGCTNSTTFSLVSQNSMYLSARETNTNCHNEPIGAIDLRVSGGTAPFTYEWSNGETTEDIEGLTEGTYTVKVTDALGCTSTLIKRVRQNTFYLFGTAKNQICDTPGSIDLTVSYAEEPISYEWSNGATTQNIDNLSPGQYSVTVVDGRGCEVSRSFNIYESNNLRLTFNSTIQGCGEQTVYSLEGLAVSGTAPYTYEWSNGATESILENVQPGTYGLTVSDANGCSRTDTYTIEPQTNNTDCLIQANATNINCGTSSNKLFSDITDAQSYQWSVTSSDGLWTIDIGDNNDEISFTAGGENSTATFSLQVTTTEGCVALCTYTVNSCKVSDSNDPSDGDNPDDGTDSDDGTDDSGGDTTGDDDPDNSGGEGTDGDNDGNDNSGGDGTDGDDGTDTDNDGNPSDDGSIGNEGDDDGTDDSESGGTEDDSEGSEDDSGDNEDNSGDESDQDSEDSNEGGDNGNDKSCIDCFDAQVSESILENDVYHYTITVSSDLMCNFDLSNMVIEIPECAVAESYSNSAGWKMVKVNADKNTGLTGIKIDNIPSFGKDASDTEFTIELNLQATTQECQKLLACWSPQVAFKAGQCVIKETIAEHCIQESISFTAYPNPASGSVRINMVSLNEDELYSVEMFDTQGIPLKRVDGLEVIDIVSLSISLENVRSSFVYLKITGSKGSSWTSKVMISQ